MKLINLTPHGLTVYGPAGVTEIPASGTLARVRSTTEVIGEVDGIPVIRPEFQAIIGLPDAQPGITYLVSTIILSALKAQGTHRSDVVAPATGPNDGCIRNGAGQVQGITRLAGM
jgi:hypothetical protein